MLKTTIFMKLKPTDPLRTTVAMLPEENSTCIVSLVLDIPIKNMVTWQEHHSVVGLKIYFIYLCILRECCTVDWIGRTGWAWGGSGYDTVHTLSRAVGELSNEQCCHENSKWHRLSHCVKWLQKDVCGHTCVPTNSDTLDYRESHHTILA